MSADKVNLNDVAAELTLTEGLGDQMSIAQVKELLAILGRRWRGMPWAEAEAEFNAIKDRAGK